MELAGVVGMPTEGLRPDILTQILVKDEEASVQQPGKAIFWVFNRAQENVIPAPVLAEPHGQLVQAVSDNVSPEVPAERQSSITDFFSPRTSTPLANVPVLIEGKSGCAVGEPPLDQETAIQQLEQKLEQLKRKQRNSQTTPLSVSDSSGDETLFGSLTQFSKSSTASPASGKNKVESKSSSSSSEDAATELGGTSQAKNTAMNEAKEETDKYWIEKDEERLTVIANMENTMAKMKSELANTVTAFQMASDANIKLQAELERKTTSLSQVKDDMNEVVHDLNAADMSNEKLKKDLADSSRDCKHHYARAEEAVTLVQADPSKETIANLLQAKAEAESRNILKQKEMELELDTLNSQLKERCNSVARLTESLSRVADSDRWVNVKKELEELWDRANKFPEELRIALHECDEWKERYHVLQESQEEELEKIHESGLEATREVRRQLKEKAAKSERALGECLKQVFERMVRCTLCLETQGFSPFDRKHFAICKQVVKLTGEDYQKPILHYYEEHDIQEDFSWIEDDNEDDDEDGPEKIYYVNSDIRARIEEPGRQGNDQDQNGSIGNHSCFDLQKTNILSGPADPTHDSSQAPASAIIEADIVTATAAEGKEVQSSPQSDEAWGKLEAAHTVCSSDSSSTAADQPTTAVAGPSAVVEDAGTITSGDFVRAVEVASSSETADEAGDVHENTVPAPAASTKPESSKDFTFSQPIFTSEWAEATNLSTAASDNESDTGKTSAFVFGKNSPPSFSATPVSKSGEDSVSPGPSRNSKSREATSPSSADKGSRQNIWGVTSFAIAEDKPDFQPVPAGALGAKSKETLPTFKSSVTSNPAEVTISASGNAEAKEGSRATKARKEAASSTTEKVSIFPQPGMFNFGRVNGPVSFTASAPSFPPRDTQPTSTGVFSVGGQSSPSTTVQPKEQAGEYGVAEVKSPKEDKPKIEAPKEKVPEETFSEEEAHKEELSELEVSPQEEEPKGKRMKKAKKANSKEENMPKESPAPTASNPSRKERKAAKKAQEKAAQKALHEARNAKVLESRRVEKAMRMK